MSFQYWQDPQQQQLQPYPDYDRHHHDYHHHHPYSDSAAAYGDTPHYDEHEEDEKRRPGRRQLLESGGDPFKGIMATVAKLVERELKAILQRDINKKLCESYAFLLFDKWWADKVS